MKAAASSVLFVTSPPEIRVAYDPVPVYLEALKEFPKNLDVRVSLADYYLRSRFDAEKALPLLGSTCRVNKSRVRGKLSAISDYGSPFPEWLSDPDLIPLAAFSRLGVPISIEARREILGNLRRFRRLDAARYRRTGLFEIDVESE